MTRLFPAVFLLLTAAMLSQARVELINGDEFDSPGVLHYDASQVSKSTSQNATLDGRSLIASWLGKRQLSCDPGYGLCTAGDCCPMDSSCCPDWGCCDSGYDCCVGTIYCVETGGVCCSLGSCPPGWGCCDGFSCYPLGGDCCSDGDYCDPGNICVIYNGMRKCCTDLHCTAYVSNSITYSATMHPTGVLTTSVPAFTTTAAATTSDAEVFIYYYYTLTWYYYSYYWIEVSLTASTEITRYSTITIYDDNSSDAYESFLDMSSTITFVTPSAATAILTQNPPTTSSTPSRTSSTTNHLTAPTLSVASSSSTLRSGGDGDGNAAAGRATVSIGAFALAFLAMSLSSGMLMIWL